MSKAGSLMRRSGVKIRSLGSNHGDLQMIIGQLKDTRTAAKGFATAQASAVQDLVRWAAKDDNRAIQDAVCQAGEIFELYAEVQKEFAEQLKDFRNHFQMIMDGEKQVDLAKAALEAKEVKVRKDLKKAGSKKGEQQEVNELTDKLNMAGKEKELAAAEFHDRAREHEVVKMIRVKDALTKLNQVRGFDASRSILCSCDMNVTVIIYPILSDKTLPGLLYVR
jgi:hypothetical protein